MKILLDESIDVRLKKHFADHECYTVKDMDWNGVKNGTLLRNCYENEFRVLITSDRNLNFQQNISSYNVIVIVLIAVDNTLSKHELLIPSVRKIVKEIEEIASHKNYYEVRY